MKRWILLSAIVGSFVGGASFLACGGGDDASVADGDGGADGSVATDDGGSTTQDDSGGGGGDAGTNPDGSKADTGPGGSNPGQIACGGSVCSTASQSCCDPFGDAGPSCFDAGAQCIGTNLACDESADCNDGGTCCFELAPTRARCRATCNGPGRSEVCKTSAECGDGGTCKAYTCQNGLSIMTCKKPIGCN